MQSLYDVSYWIKCGKCDDKISVSNETLPAIVFFFFMNRLEQNNRNLSIAANEYKIVCTWLIDVIWMQITCSNIRLYVCIINADVVDFLIIFFSKLLFKHWFMKIHLNLWSFISFHQMNFSTFFLTIIIFILGIQKFTFHISIYKIFFVDSVNSNIMGCLFTYNEVHHVH